MRTPRTQYQRWLWLAGLWLVAANGFGAEAGGLLAKTGLTGGVAVFPQTAEPAAIVAAAQQSNWVVYAVAEGDRAAGVQAAGLASGTLGQTLYVGNSTGALADKLAAAVVVPAAKTSDLTAAHRAAWLRVLAPRRGTLVVGHRQPEPGLKATLEQFATGLDAVRWDTTDGLWLVARRPADAGADEWTHRWHDPANGRFSRDQTFQPPFLPQWYDWPVFRGWWNSCVAVGGGRMFFITAPRPVNTPAELECRELGSGVKLWAKPFAWAKPRGKNVMGVQPGRSMMVYAHNALWLALDHEIVKLDAETGQEIGRFAGAAAGSQIKWLAVAGDRLLMLAGAMDEYDCNVLQRATTNPFGTIIAAWDAHTGRPAWSEMEQGAIDEREIAARDGKLYYHAAGARVACRNLADGKVLWENRDAKLLSLLVEKTGKAESLPALLNAVRVLTADPAGLYFEAIWLANKVALNPADGRLLWSQKQKTTAAGRAANYVAANGKLHTKDGVFELKTGNKISDVKIPGSGCGPSTVVGDDLYVTAFGKCVRGAELLREMDLKPDCETGVVIADGIGVSPSGACNCALEMRGYRAFAAAPGLNPHGPGESASRFARGTAFGQKPGENAASADWPAYGGGYRHANATAVRVEAGKPATAWTWQPARKTQVVETILSKGDIAAPEFYPTQAIQVGGRICFGDAQGVVRMLDGATGKEVWQYAIGFKILGAPAFAGGRVYAAAADGWLYCLAADNGALAWKFRAAPYDRLIRLNGQLVSTWPALGGPLVNDGVVYLVAGYQSGNGVHACALDAATGAVRWETHDAGSGGAAGLEAATANLGMTTIAGGRLWYCSSTGIPGSFDLKDGSWRAEPPGEKGAAIERRGQEMAALDEDWIIYGGRRLAQPFECWYATEKELGYSICRTRFTLPEAKRGVKRVQVGSYVAENAMFPPAFDGQTILLGADFGARGARAGVLAAYARSALLTAAAALQPEPKIFSNTVPYYFGDLTGGQGQNLPSAAAWSKTDFNPMMGVLAANAVVVAHQLPAKDRFTPGAWKLAALDRADGHELWSVDLPTRPAWNGLSVGANGRIVLALWDGSVVAW